MNLKSNSTARVGKPYKGIAMEGLIAKWYAQNARRDVELTALAARLAQQLPAGSRVLEVAPGPGYLSIELAKRGSYESFGLDISKTFVEIAQANARQAGVTVEFRQGNAAQMPFDADRFNFIVCTAAFKNFTDPVGALAEMWRVLKPGGKALIVDLRRDVAPQVIDDYVRSLHMNPLNAWFTKLTFDTMLRKNAYTTAELKAFVAQTPFTQFEIRLDPMGFELWLTK